MAYSRKEYIQSLNRMRANYQNQGNPLINRENDDGSVGQELSSFAFMDTTVPAPKQANKGKGGDFLSQLFGAIDEIAARFGAGFVGAWEGGLDLAANFIGAIGDWTGWYDSKTFTDWAKQDLGTAAAEWVKTYANLTPWGIAENISNGNYANEDYWKSAAEGAKDIVGSAAFASNRLDKDYRQDADKYYGLDDQLDTQVGQFLGEAAQTIGFMLPSIMVGGATGLSGNAAKAVSTGVMGAMSGGKSSEEALNEGANASQALAYGALSGAVEAGTEWIPFPGGNAAGGVIGGKFTGQTMKTIVKEMVEEGTEEVVSELLNPLIKAITYDKDAVHDYGKGDYWVGVAKAFGSGAVMGGVFSGINYMHQKSVSKKISPAGMEIIENLQGISDELSDAQKKYRKGKISEADYEKIALDIGERVDSISNEIKSMPKEYRENLTQMFLNPKEFRKNLADYKRYSRAENGRPLNRTEVLEYRAERAYSDTVDYLNGIKDASKFLKVPKTAEFDGKKVKMPKDASAIVSKNANMKDVQNFINSIDGDSNYMVRQNGINMVVQPFESDGKVKYGYYAIDPKTNEVTKIGVRASRPEGIKFSVVPKAFDADSGAKGLTDSDGKEIRISEQAGKIVVDEEGTSTLSGIKKVGYIGKIKPEDVVKKFNINPSLKKTIGLKLNAADPKSILEYLRKAAGLESTEDVVRKMGYDALIGNDGSVIGKNLLSKITEAKETKDEGPVENRKGNKDYTAKDGRRRFLEEISGKSKQTDGGTRTFGNGETAKRIRTVPKSLYNEDLKSIERKMTSNYGFDGETVFGIFDENENGFYDPKTNTIVININTADLNYETAVRHEIEHYRISKGMNEAIESLNSTKDFYSRIKAKTAEKESWEQNVLDYFDQISKEFPKYSYDEILEELHCALYSGELTDGKKGALINDRDISFKVSNYWKDVEKSVGNYRMSKKVNSKGYALPYSVVKAFEKTKVRTLDGDLLVAYHGTKSTEFTAFDIGKTDYQHSAFGFGMYLTNRESRAYDYAGDTGKVLRLYANITNPIMESGHGFDAGKLNALSNALKSQYGIDLLDEISRSMTYEKAIEENNKNGEFYKFASANGMKFSDIEELADSGFNDLEILKTIETSIGYENPKITPKQLVGLIAETTGFDGVIAWRGEYFGDGAQFVVFRPNQVKDILDYSPNMKSDDLKFSVSVGAEQNPRVGNVVTKPNEASVGIAITYDLTSDKISEISKRIEKYKNIAFKRTSEIAKILGLEIEQSPAIGGWTWTDSEDLNKVGLGGEPSYPIIVKNIRNFDDVRLFSALLGDTAYEVQNSVGYFRYDENGADYEDRIYLTKIDDGLFEIFKSAKLLGFNLNEETKTLVIDGASDDTIETLINALKKGEYYEKSESTKCEIEWLSLEKRGVLYESWLNAHKGSKDGSTYRYVEQAYKINKYILENSHEDSEGNIIRNEGISSNASEILKLIEENKAPNPPNNRTQKEIIKDSANLRHEKVYSLATSSQIVENALTNMLDKWDNAVKITIPQGKANAKEFVFEELNLYKDKQKAISSIVSQIEDATVTFDNGENGREKVPLRELGMHDDLTKAIAGLVEHKGDLSEKSKWVRKYYDTIRRYASYVHERAMITSEYVTAVKAQKTLDKIFSDTRAIKMGGDAVVNEITLYKQLTSNLLLSKSAKNVAPSSFTKLINNFSNYTAENYSDYFDPSLKALVDELALSFENGRFPNREPSLGEMQLFNAIRARIIARCNELASEKHQQRVRANEEGTLLASVTLPSIEPKSYGKVKNVLDSSLSFVAKIRSVLGDGHPFVKFFTEDYLRVSSSAISTADRFRRFNFEDLAQQAGYKGRGELLKSLDERIYEIPDRSGKVHKKTVNDVIGAYWTYKTAQEQLLSTGLTSYDRANKTDVDFKIGEETYQEMFSRLPQKAKAWADLVYEKYFNGMDYEYKASIIKEFFGDLNFLNSRKGTYAPTQRVGQVNMGVGATSQYDAGYLSTMLKGFLKERVRNKNHFRWLSAVDVLENNMQQVSSWGEKSQWVDNIRTALNTTIPGVGNHTLEYYLDKHVPEWKQVWSPYMSKIILGKQILEKKHGLLEFLGNVGQISTLGANIGSTLRQTLSDFSWTFDDRVTWRSWAATIPQAVANFFRMGKIKKELMESNGYFIERFNQGEVIKAIMNGNLPSRIGQVVLKPMEWMDSVVVTTHGYALAQRIVNNGIRTGTYSFERNSPEYKREVAHVLQGMVLISQSNSDPMFMSRLRSGDAGWINREVFGRFASDNQNKYQALHRITVEKANSEKRIKALEQAIKSDAYTDEQKESFRKSIERESAIYKKNFGGKVGGFLASILLNGLGAYIITHLVRKIKGKEEWDEINNENMLRDVFLESSVNWMPYLGTIANAIENNSDVSAFTVEKLNNLIDTVKLVEQAFKKGDEASVRKAILAFVQNGLELTGVPAKNIYELVMGIWYQFDKEGSLTAQSWVKGYQSSYMKSKFSEDAKKGNIGRAEAEFGAWSSMYGTDTHDDATIKEIVRLTAAGYAASPTANAKSYTNEQGEKASFTKVQAQVYKEEYAKSNAVVSELIRIEGYAKQDDKAKASIIRKAYSSYAEYAQARALGVPPSGKLAKLLYYTNGDVDLAKYILSMQQLSAVSEDRRRTRKENVILAINKLKGFNRREKLLLAYLSGYSIAESNHSAVISFLVGKGFSRKEAKDFLGIGK